MFLIDLVREHRLYKHLKNGSIISQGAYTAKERIAWPVGTEPLKGTNEYSYLTRCLPRHGQRHC